MKCPNCEHTSTMALQRCYKCGEVYEYEPLARYEHLQFFLEWLEQHSTTLSRVAYTSLQKTIQKEIVEVRAVLIPPAPPPVEVALPITVTPPAVVQLPPTLQPVTPHPPPVAPTPKPIVSPPKPSAPPIDWGKVWERVWGLVVSGALLRGLLYLGAFMIVVSAVVLVTVFWNNFPLPIQIGFILAVPLLFYAGGFAVRELLKIPVAGGVLTGIGALLIAVDFAAVYQLARITLDVNLYWLIAALMCLVIYTFTAWRVRGQFFNYITLIALSNVLFAFTRALRLPLEWQIASVTASAVMMVGTAILLRGESWREFSDSSRRLPLILLPASLFFILFVPGNAAFGQVMAFMLACAGYALLAWRFPHVLYMYGATWSLIIAIEFILRGFNVRYEWHPTLAAILAAAYLTAGKIFSGRLPESFKPRRSYALAIYIAGFGLAIIAVSGGFISLIVSLWASVVALALTSLVLVWSAYLFRRAAFVFLAAALFIAPFSLALGQWLIDFKVLQWVAWLALAWSTLSLAYMFIAVVLRKAETYAVSLNLWAQALLPLALAGLFLNYVFTSRDWFAAPTLIALGGVIAVYLASAIIHDSDHHPALSKLISWLPPFISRPFFLTPPSFLIPLWVAIAWWNSILDRNWLGVALAANALVFVGVGQLLARRRVEYRWLVHAVVYPICAAGVAFALRDKLPLTVTLYVVVINVIALAFVYKLVIEIAAASFLFLVPFYLTLDLVRLDLNLYPLVFMLLASLIYVPLGIVLDRFKRLNALPLYGVGYGVSLLAVLLSLTQSRAVQWTEAVVPLIACVLYVFSTYRFKQIAFAFGAAIVFCIGYGQALFVWRVSNEYFAMAWVSLALAYMLLERGLNKIKNLTDIKDPSGSPPHWWSHFCLPLGLLAVVLCGLGFALTMPNTVSAFTGRALNDYTPILITQALVVLFTILATWLYHRPFPLFVEPVVAFFLVTLFFNAYSQQLFGTKLSLAQYGIVWVVLGAVHVTLAALLDFHPRRYARGLYVGGYALTVLAVLWTVVDRMSNLYALGLAILLAIISQVLVHLNLHRGFDEFINAFFINDAKRKQTARAFFLFVSVYAFPFWLGQLLAQLNILFSWRGVVFAVLAVLYAMFGLALRRVHDEYKKPFYSAGYVLSVISIFIASGDRLPLIYALLIVAALYAASAYVFRQSLWLFPSNALVLILVVLILDYNHLITNSWLTRSFTALAFICLGLGYFFQKRKAESERIGQYALPFLFFCYLLSVSTLVDSFGDKYLAIETYLLQVVLFILSAYLFRQKLFLYPAAWLMVVPYFNAMTLTVLPPKWYGVGWLPLIISYIAIGYWGFKGKGINTSERLRHASTPFYIMGYALSVIMILTSRGEALTFTVALAAGATLYFVSAYLFAAPLWSYPALVAAHLAALSYFAISPSDKPAYYITLPFAFVTWLTMIVGYILSRRFPIPTQSISKVIAHLLTPSWSQPFFIALAFDLIAWQALALYGFDTGIILATSNALLLGVLALLWSDVPLAYASLFYLALAIFYRLRWTSLHWAEQFAIIGGIGFGFYLLGWIAEAASPKFKRLMIWIKPLTHGAIASTAFAVSGTLSFIITHTTMSAATFASAGAFATTHAYRTRSYRLGYVGMALLEVAFALLLMKNDAREMQVYALPAGLYFVAVGFFERRLRKGLLAVAIESFGLVMLLLTAFMQSLNANTGFPYFVLLLVEGLLIIWWGAGRRFKIPFFIGLIASVVNVVAQIILLLNTLGLTQGFGRFIIIFAVGVILVIVAIFVERQRIQIITKAREWREALEIWE